MIKACKLTLPFGLNAAVKTFGHPENKPLLALHGWLDNANSFLPISEFLQQHFYIIAIDFIGHGLSSHLPQGAIYHFTDALTHISWIMDALKLEQVTLLGHSMGAALASMFAACFAQKVTELYLIEGLGPMPEQVQNTTLRLRKAILSQRKIRRLKYYAQLDDAAHIRAHNTPMTFENARLLVERGMKKVEKGFVWSHDLRLLQPSSMRFTESQVLNLLSHIQCPVKLLLADEGLSIPEHIYKPRLECIKNLSLNQISGYHHVHMDCAEQTAKILFGIP